MPTFLRFPNGGDILFNADHIVSVQCLEKQVEEADMPRVAHLFHLGQTIYLVRLQVSGCGKMDIENTLEAERDTIYEQLIAVLQPVVIGMTAPPRKAPAKTRKAPAAKKKAAKA